MKLFISVASDSGIGKSGTTLFTSRTLAVTGGVTRTVIVDLNFVNQDVGCVYGYNRATDQFEPPESPDILPFRYYTIEGLTNAWLCVVSGKALETAEKIVNTLAYIAQDMQAARILVDTNATLAHYCNPDLFANNYPSNWEVNFFFHWSFHNIANDIANYREYMEGHNNIYHVVNLSKYWANGTLQFPVGGIGAFLNKLLAGPNVNNILSYDHKSLVANNIILDILEKGYNEYVNQQDVSAGCNQMIASLLAFYQMHQQLPLNLLITPYSTTLATSTGSYRNWTPNNVQRNINQLDAILQNDLNMQRYKSQLDRIIYVR